MEKEGEPTGRPMKPHHLRVYVRIWCMYARPVETKHTSSLSRTLVVSIRWVLSPSCFHLFWLSFATKLLVTLDITVVSAHGTVGVGSSAYLRHTLTLSSVLSTLSSSSSPLTQSRPNHWAAWPPSPHLCCGLAVVKAAEEISR